ncbi:hypothetical protein BD626DRAFT_572905 [Schizophyllum amplum]|uniref:Zinc finger PHD-type domain-containing protein n=1 Tax=Schizophyllum amplum TaxID=97359 RepID=A0A550C324_9AGAR|nr:hypothetical protein BD626DRAFT_572905 [Auriculariopsis ampla]
MIKPLPRINTTPRAVKVSAQPDVISSSSRAPGNPLKTQELIQHEHMDRAILDELANAMLLRIKGLPEALFPDDAFAVTPAALFKIIVGPLPSNVYGRNSTDTGGIWVNGPKFNEPHQELAIAEFFQSLTDSVRTPYRAHMPPGVKLEERKWSAAYRNTAFPGGDLKRKPDIVNLCEDLPRLWKYLLGDVQHKANIQEMEAVARQLHDGGWNTLSAQDDRLFHIGLGIAGDDLSISYYDRAGCMRSEPLNIHREPVLFVRVVLGLALLDKRYLGYDPTVTEDENGQRFVTVKKEIYRILERLDKHTGIRGLGTVVWLCERLTDERQVVMKTSWADRSRQYTEAHFLEHAAKMGLRGVPTLIAFETVKFKNHCISTAPLRQELCKRQRLTGVEERQLVRLVEKERCVSLADFSTKAELLSGLRDCVIAHEGLYKDAKIVHSDVSDKNTMFQTDKTTAPGRRRGILIDLNYATYVGQEHKPSLGAKSCPATFMACELLLGGKDQETVGALKQAIMGLKVPGEPDLFGNFLEDHFDPYFEDLKECVCELRSVIMCKQPRPTHRQVVEVLDKHINVLLLAEPASTPRPVSESRPVSNSETFAGLLLIDGAEASEDEEELSVQTSRSESPSDGRDIATSSELQNFPRTRTSSGELSSRATTRGSTKRAAPQQREHQSPCDCGKVAPPLGSDSIKCKGQCSVFYHLACVKDDLNVPEDQWICEDCRPLRPLKKSKATTDSD